MHDLSTHYRIGVSTVSQVIHEVCEAIWSSFNKMFFSDLTPDFLLNVTEGFELRANFSHCIRAIDGKHTYYQA